MTTRQKNRKTLSFYTTYFNYIKRTLIIALVFLSFANKLSAQSSAKKDSVPALNLDQCIAYALEHQPGVQQSVINMAIAQKTNDINLSGWLPQVYIAGSLTHYNQLTTALEENPSDPSGPLVPVKTGLSNTATPQLAATETLLSPTLLYSAKSAHLLVEQAQQANDSSKIGIVATVSKAFYNLLQNYEQIDVLKEDTARLGKNLKDAYHQYKGGIVDKTDYEEAAISLNNSKAQLRQGVEAIKPQYAVLKQIMGFPPDQNFNVVFDTSQMANQVAIDTTQQLKFENRIEYQILQTQRSIQQENIDFYRYDFLPTISANFNYVNEFESNSLSTLFSTSYPYSYEGLSISIPIFTGFSRLENIQRAKLQGQILDLDEYNLKSSIYSQYYAALAAYKSNLYNMQLLKENVSMAKETYSVVELQYRQGVVPYLNVITAESNLISSEISYIDALFQVLQNKVDLQKAMGTIAVKH